jgi:hypothetical protein
MIESPLGESSRKSPRTRRSLLDSWIRTFTQRHWWSTTFTGPNFRDMLRSLAWVAPLTILIWIYAEREQIGTPTLSDVPIRVTGNNLFVSPDQWRVSLELKGPQSGLDKVQLAVGKPPGLQINLENSTARGHQHINVIDRIQNDPLFRNSGITVTKSDPVEIDLDVDDLVDRTIAVQSPPDAANLEATTHYEPRVVIAHGPKSTLDLLAKQGKLSAVVDFMGLGALTPGHHTEQSVDVVVPGKDITLDPPAVKAFLDVKSPDETITIPAMPILVKAPPNVLDENKIEVPASITGITVSGPPKQLQLLRENVPTAVLTITPDDVVHPQPKQLDYVFPKDAKDVVVSPADQARTVEFQLTKR